MAIDTVTYAAARSYTNKALAGGGAIKGKNCIVKSIEQIPGGNRVTFEWTYDDGTVDTATMDVFNGQDVIADWVSGKQYEVGMLVIHDTNKLFKCIVANSDVIWNSSKWMAVGGGSGGSADLSADMTTTKAVGGISIGTQYAAGTSLETILRDMLSPVLYPTFTNPSASISIPGDKILEIGSTANKTVTITFNRGSINPAYGTSGYRSGAATGYILNSGTEQAGNTFAVVVSESNKTFSGKVNYAAGEQPKDSAGNNYSSPLPAGSVNTSTITYEFVYAMWANTSSAATVAKLGLVSKSAGSRQLDFPATTTANPETFDLPTGWTMSKIEVYNSLSGKWETATSQFTASATTHTDAAGNTVNYTRYSCNYAGALGARNVKVYWS